jgi:hypothetical protein
MTIAHGRRVITFAGTTPNGPPISTWFSVSFAWPPSIKCPTSGGTPLASSQPFPHQISMVGLNGLNRPLDAWMYQDPIWLCSFSSYPANFAYRPCYHTFTMFLRHRLSRIFWMCHYFRWSTPRTPVEPPTRLSFGTRPALSPHIIASCYQCSDSTLPRCNLALLVGAAKPRLVIFTTQLSLSFPQRSCALVRTGRTLFQNSHQDSAFGSCARFARLRSGIRR